MNLRTVFRIAFLTIAIAFPPLARSEPVPEALRALPLGEVKPEGWLRAQMERDLKTGFHGNLDLLLQHRVTGEYLLHPTNNDYVLRAKNQKSRRNEEGLTIPAAPQAWWTGEMIGDWHDGLLRAAFLVGDQRARAKAERFIEDVLKSQDEDGYIGVYPKGYRFHFASVDGELWTQRCAFLPMLAYYEFTGRQDVLAAVERAVQLTIRQYGPGTNYFANPKQPNSGVSHGLLFVDVLEWLHRITSKEEYRKAAVKLYEDYSASQTVANKDAQLGRLLDPAQPLGGHGPDIMGFLRVPLLCYHLTGNDRFLQAWNNSLLKLDRHLGVGGSPLSGHREEIKVNDQTPDMPYEFCSTFYLLHSLTWGMQKQADTRYSDMFEKTIFNAAQGARFPDGRALTYYSADERLWVRQNPPEGIGNYRYIYTAAHYPSCCHNSGARAYPYMIPSMWLRSTGADGEGLAAVLYGPSKVSTEVRDAKVSITEETDYPFSFDIQFTIEVDQPIRFPLRLRVPEWAVEHKVSARGAQVRRDDRGFIVVEREWKSGDKVRLDLEPAVQARTALNGTTAIAYGPLVFSLPIPERAEIVQRFPEAEKAGFEGFYAYQYDPADLVSAKRVLRLSQDRAPFGFRPVRDKKADFRYPWDRSPIRLRGKLTGADGKPETVTLLPMGSTILRRTCFEH